MSEHDRLPLDRIDDYLEGIGRALRQDQTYEELKTSSICLCNALRNLVGHLKGSDETQQLKARVNELEETKRALTGELIKKKADPDYLPIG